ncbi:MAG: polyprenyl synthetase family protein [Hungatella sp.]
MNPKEQLQQYTKEVEQVIEAYLPKEEGYQKTVLEAMNYSMRAGGKRIRPLLMRETYRLFGSGDQEVEPFMAAIEMIHTFSLIHDDLPCMDNDKLRRGLATTWVKYGYDMAVLAGDALFIYAMETASKAYALSAHPERVGRCIQILSAKSGIYGMLGGQTADVELTDHAIDSQQLDFIYRLKTGALLEAPMMIGAVLGGADESQIRIAEAMAAAIGMAFQIQDDILDLTGREEVLGKPIQSDAKNHKTTYVSLKGLEQAKTDVARISAIATQQLHMLPGDTGFLESLIEMLVNREK